MLRLRAGKASISTTSVSVAVDDSFFAAISSGDNYMLDFEIIWRCPDIWFPGIWMGPWFMLE
ncbi:hypothetical protein JMJ77_0006896 [Colletotrichum scovillei]|uniref:Uncharacterized protein n=1 Tax=Colletotrichum scovillei TaxID=1209932 RepID=A0A9P7RKJ3_9PEZI|nr:hypothetical protein JMJ77_0006896 [Colletotrichum scovillei]KAG7078141.1 hypothetical protein JMJ76_0015376 [Colletotrichum scovillei]KAG7085252.1 hypothetical protein JMJ78_0010677 [Colletotrichum scovillei]